jgi:50S ribosomal subunit-associated GTPase HflX
MPQGNLTQKVLTREDHQLHLKIWEPSGGEASGFHHLADLQDVAGALLVCDLTRPETLESLYTYAQSLREANPQACTVVAANKADLVREYALTVADLDALCRAIHSQFLYTSAKTGENVQRIIDLLADRL